MHERKTLDGAPASFQAVEYRPADTATWIEAAWVLRRMVTAQTDAVWLFGCVGHTNQLPLIA